MKAIVCAVAVLATGCATDKLGNDRLDIGPVSIKSDTLARGADIAQPGSGKAVKGVFAASRSAFGKDGVSPEFEAAGPDVVTITDATGRVVVQPVTITRTRLLKPQVRTVNIESHVAAVDEVAGILSDLEASRNKPPADTNAINAAVDAIIGSGIVDEVTK